MARSELLWASPARTVTPDRCPSHPAGRQPGTGGVETPTLAGKTAVRLGLVVWEGFPEEGAPSWAGKGGQEDLSARLAKPARRPGWGGRLLTRVEARTPTPWGSRPTPRLWPRPLTCVFPPCLEVPFSW